MRLSDGKREADEMAGSRFGGRRAVGTDTVRDRRGD